MRKKHFTTKKARNRTALYDYMTPVFWRVHYLIPAAIGFMALGMALGIAHFTYRPYGTLALASDNIRGWAWTPNVGWFSLNDQNAGACATPPCGTYGLNIEPATSTQPHWDPAMLPGSTLEAHRINGFAWSDNVGFICFGASCNIAACHGGFYPAPPGNAFYAYAEPVTDPSPKRLHGWGVICNQNVLGWISLSCQDTGSCTGGSTVNYQLAYNPSDHRFHSGAVNGSPFGWNGNTDGSGLGYISFYPSTTSPDGMRHQSAEIEDTPAECSDFIDNNLNGYRDCADSTCWGTTTCPEICTDGVDNDADTLVDCNDSDCFGPACPENTPPLCSDAQDNDGDTAVDCADSDCFSPACPEVCGDGMDNDADGFIDCADADCPPCPEICDDTVDNDGDGDIDCADADCALDPACVPPQHQCNVSPDPLCAAEPDPAKHADCCCNDQDDNATGLIDCLDPDCRGNAAVCSAWLQVETRNIYALGGIIGTAPAKQTNLYNTKYCLRADQTIEWTSEESCKAESAGPIQLPSASTKYRNRLGFLDLAGMRVNGRYGEVWDIGGAEQIPDQLNGRIYRYSVQDVTLNIPARIFLNGTGLAGDGSGLLLVEGADLHITGDIAYEANPVQSRLKNLASFGVIAVKIYDALGNPHGGNIHIDPSVSKISGVYFAEGTIHTGTTGAPLDPYLSMYGIFIANQFNLQRDNNINPMLPAERIIFDGRAVVNPPPGMEDAAKSLPCAIGVSF